MLTFDTGSPCHKGAQATLRKGPEEKAMNPADRHLESSDSRYRGEQQHLGRMLVCESELTIVSKQHPSLVPGEDRTVFRF